MTFMGILRRIFKKNAKTIVLDKNELLKHKPSVTFKKQSTDKSIFEVIHTFTLNEHGTTIAGKIKRGFFKTGDKIVVCNPTNTCAKLEAIIVNIKTSLVDVNRINSGTEADFLIKTINSDSKISPGDRAYKI